jgi:2-methylcitrate dehydratase PrpD
MQGNVPQGQPARAGRKRRGWEKIQRQLDEALDASFPASDPVSIVTSHEEEDWGTEPAVPEPPAKPAPPRDP